jgi:hypothetical protein
MLHSTVRGKARLYQPSSDGRVLSAKFAHIGVQKLGPGPVLITSTRTLSRGRLRSLSARGLEAGDHDPQPFVVRSIFVRFDANATSDAITPSFGSLIQRTLDFASTASNHKSLILR